MKKSGRFWSRASVNARNGAFAYHCFLDEVASVMKSFQKYGRGWDRFKHIAVPCPYWDSCGGGIARQLLEQNAVRAVSLVQLVNGEEQEGKLVREW